MKKRVNFKNKIEEHFGISFAEFVSKNFTLGMTREDCTRVIWDMSNDVLKPKSSTIWNYVKAGISDGTITGFDFVKKKTVQKRERIIIKESAKPTVVIPDKLMIKFVCSCGKEHLEEKDSVDTLLLMSHKCPECNKRGSCHAVTDINGIIIRKKMATDENGIRVECFVDENNEIILNPLIDYEMEEETLEA